MSAIAISWAKNNKINKQWNMKLSKLKKVFETIIFILFILSVIFSYTNFEVIKNISIKLFRHPLIYVSHVQRQYMISQHELCRNSSSILNVKIPDLYEVDRYQYDSYLTTICSHDKCVSVFQYFTRNRWTLSGVPAWDQQQAIRHCQTRLCTRVLCQILWQKLHPSHSV